jgi:hypothetical protein
MSNNPTTTPPSGGLRNLFSRNNRNNPTTTLPNIDLKSNKFINNTNKISSIIDESGDNQRTEQTIFLRKFNEDFIKYKNILKDKLEKLKQQRLEDIRLNTCPIADNKCLTLDDNKIIIYNNINLIVGIIFIFISIVLIFNNFNNK